MKLKDIKRDEIKQVFKRAIRFLEILLLPMLVAKFLYYYPMLSIRENFFIDYRMVLEVLVVAIIINLMLLFSITRIVAIEDDMLKNDFYAVFGWDAKFGKKALFFIKHRRIQIAAAIVASIYIMFPIEFTSPAFAELVLKGSTNFGLKLLGKLLVIAALLFDGLMALNSATHVWITEQKREGKQEKRSKFAIVGIVLAYAVGGLYLPVVNDLILSLIQIVAAFFKEFKSVPMYIAVGLLILSPFIYKYAKAISTRKKLIKGLKRLQKEENCIVTKVKSPYKSIFKQYIGESFKLTTESGKKYSCKVLGTASKNTPFIIYPNGSASYIASVGFFKSEAFSYNKSISFAYEADEPKILILNPIPKFCYTVLGSETVDFKAKKRDDEYAEPITTGSHKAPKVVYVTYNGKTVPIDNGDVIGGYKIYSTSAFINAADRDCLDR